MQHEFPTIDFECQAEVRSRAEHRRTEEIAGLLRTVFAELVTRFRRKPTVVGAVQYALVEQRRFPQRRA